MRNRVGAAGLTGTIEIDSAGVTAEHAGQPPDRRAAAEARKRGIDLESQRARQVTADDWERYDLLLVVDDLVERRLRRDAPAGADPGKVVRITDFAGGDGGPDSATEVPDPYYGGDDGFRAVYDLLDDACTGLLDHVRRLGRPASPDAR